MKLVTELGPRNIDPEKHMLTREYRIGGVYTKECHLPVGYTFPQHRHSYEHTSVLVSGTAVVAVDGIETVYTGPAVLCIEAKKEHSVTPVTPCIWLCQHAMRGGSGNDSEFVLDDEELYE